MDHRMTTAERERRILELLRASTVLTVPELESALQVSPATIRRDLQSLHERKLLERIRGGATLGSFFRIEPLFHDKQTKNAAAKQAIAEAALSLIDDHDRIYLDGGSTVLMLARLLSARRDLTVVTNSLVAAEPLIHMNHRLILVGGEFRAISRTLVGPLTSSVIDSIHVDKAFMGTIGFTPADGMTTTDPNEAFTKQCVMKRANQVVLLVDSEKLGVPSFARSGSCDDLDVLISDTVPAPLADELEALGIKVIRAGSGEQEARSPESGVGKQETAERGRRPEPAKHQ